MPDLSSITLPDGNAYNFKDATARLALVTSATMDSNGLIIFKNSNGASLFTLQLPIYNGAVSE